MHGTSRCDSELKKELTVNHIRRSLQVLFVMFACLFVGHAAAADLIVSAQDGKFVRVEGRATYPSPAPSDSLVLIDASQFPPVVKATVGGIDHTIQGPPQAVAITPDGKLAVVAAPSHYDYGAKIETLETFLQVVDLESSPPRLIKKVELGVHINGLSINPEGTLLLAAALDGTVKVLSITGKDLSLLDSIKIGEKRLSGVTFTHDGKAAIVAMRDEQGAAALSVEGTSVKDTGERISTGVSPYCVDVDSNGRWAVISNAGLAGKPGNFGKIAGDADTITLVDVSRRPFRAVQHLTVPAIPEGVAISPDGRWIVVQAMDGSQLTPDNPGRHPRGKVILFSVDNNGAHKVNEVPGGEAAQGIVFAKDNRTVLVQFDVEKELAIYAIRGGRLVDTAKRLKLSAGPVSIRSMPR
jgi:DNA-binding beta-propeller fold protein YncE